MTGPVTAGTRLLHLIPVDAPCGYVVKTAEVREATDEYVEVYGIRGIHRIPPLTDGMVGVRGDGIYAVDGGHFLLAAILFPTSEWRKALAAIDAFWQQEKEAADRARLHEATEPAVHVGGPHDGRAFTAAGDEGGRSYETTTGHVHTGRGPEPRYYDVYRRTTDRDPDGRVIFRHDGMRVHR